MMRLPPNALMANGLVWNTPPMRSTIAFTFVSALMRAGEAL